MDHWVIVMMTYRSGQVYILDANKPIGINNRAACACAAFFTLSIKCYIYAFCSNDEWWLAGCRSRCACMRTMRTAREWKNMKSESFATGRMILGTSLLQCVARLTGADSIVGRLCVEGLTIRYDLILRIRDFIESSRTWEWGGSWSGHKQMDERLMDSQGCLRDLHQLATSTRRVRRIAVTETLRIRRRWCPSFEDLITNSCTKQKKVPRHIAALCIKVDEKQEHVINFFSSRFVSCYTVDN